MPEVTPYSWLQLYAIMPPRFHNIINLCYEIEVYISQIDRKGIEIITENRLRRIVDMAERVMFEYMALLYPQQEKAKTDLQKEYALLFLGSDKSFLQKYVLADMRKKKDYLEAFILQLSAFIHFRVYDSLSTVNVTKAVRESFTNLSLAKTGIFEKLGEEEEEEFLK